MHPDKGGDPDKFKELTHAYEILSNPEKRDLYDRGGIDAVNNGGMPGSKLFFYYYWKLLRKFVYYIHRGFPLLKKKKFDSRFRFI